MRLHRDKTIFSFHCDLASLRFELMPYFSIRV
jgi:hypothetical protein